MFFASALKYIFAVMNKIAIFLGVLFVGFLMTPTIVTYLDENIDVSMAFTASEEENSAKTQIFFEYNIQDTNPGSLSLHFLQEQAAFNHFYNEGSMLIALDVLSPPPKQA